MLTGQHIWRWNWRCRVCRRWLYASYSGKWANERMSGWTSTIFCHWYAHSVHSALTHRPSCRPQVMICHHFPVRAFCCLVCRRKILNQCKKLNWLTISETYLRKHTPSVHAMEIYLSDSGLLCWENECIATKRLPPRPPLPPPPFAANRLFEMIFLTQPFRLFYLDYLSIMAIGIFIRAHECLFVGIFNIWRRRSESFFSSFIRCVCVSLFTFPKYCWVHFSLKNSQKLV